ncbi:MAG TPA: M3 family metallopeptidase [Chryseolinea sp.]|nr:M3 family metallopeptidase [Chryseolinea sp.]
MRSLTPLASLLLGMATLSSNFIANDMGTLRTHLSKASSRWVNPLLEEWTGPYNGVPPFDHVVVADFKPAIEAAIQEGLSEVNKIADDLSVPGFENTITALERSGKTLTRVQTIYSIWSSSMNTPEFNGVQREMAPKLAAYSDQVTQNEKLFRRIEAIYQSPDRNKLTAEQQRLVWRYYINFTLAGAKLDSAAKTSVSTINQQLAKLFTRFNQNLLADESHEVLVLENEADLAGLPTSFREAAADAADKKYPGKWVVTNTRSSIDPFLSSSDRRDLREKAWRMFINRGDNGNANDNNAIITEILQLRAQRAKLLGYPTHAHWRLVNSMAKTPENAMALMEKVWKPALASVRQEVKDMQEIANKEGKNITIEPWDYKYYADKVRKLKYSIDQDEVKKYLQLDKLRDGMFWVAGELFNFSFTPITNVPVYHPDIKVWEVKDKASGRHIGLWYFDPYARKGKRSGAWMNSYRVQQKLEDVTTIVSNNSNFVKGKPGAPVLISWDDATTLFHEFGHALHGLSSDVTYPSLSGTAVFRDYVEFPSQLLERWLITPEVLKKFAVHYQTGQPIPDNLVEKIKRSDKFNQGFATTEYLASALVDMKLHLTGDQKIDPDEFERKALVELGMPKEIVMRHRLPQFGHLFSSDSYSAGYYSYLWSDVLTTDAFEAFLDGKGAYDKTIANRLSKYVFSVGNTVDPAEGYRNFRGHDPNPDALMKKRGFKK